MVFQVSFQVISDSLLPLSRLESSKALSWGVSLFKVRKISLLKEEEEKVDNWFRCKFSNELSGKKSIKKGFVTIFCEGNFFSLNKIRKYWHANSFTKPKMTQFLSKIQFWWKLAKFIIWIFPLKTKFFFMKIPYLNNLNFRTKNPDFDLKIAQKFEFWSKFN